MEEDPQKRFSNRAAYYANARPRYPEAVLTFMRSELGLTKRSVVADIGSGTGILSELFLGQGNLVFGVEPNSEMRKTAEARLASYTNFRSIIATAEATTLPTASVDFITAGQAFHWFDPKETRAEFLRVMKPHGWVLLLWNIRKNSPGFMEAYERFVSGYANQPHFRRTATDRVGEDGLTKFLGKYKLKTFSNHQVLTFEGLLERLLSSSYIPLPNDPGYSSMLDGARRVFDSYQEGGVVRLEYDTETYYSQLTA